MVKRMEMSFKAFLICVFGDIVFYLAKGNVGDTAFWVLAAFNIGTFLLFLSQAWISLKRRHFTNI